MDYLQDYTVAQASGHHRDCDGFRYAHKSQVVRTEHGTYQAVCEECGPLHVGSATTADGARRFLAGHCKEVACDHRCKDWQ